MNTLMFVQAEENVSPLRTGLAGFIVGLMILLMIMFMIGPKK